MEQPINYKVLHDAFMATSNKRKTEEMLERFDSILDEIRADETMKDNWNKYRNENFFVGDLSRDDVNNSVKILKKAVLG